MKLGIYLCHAPSEIMVILANFYSEFLIKNHRNFTECAEAKMSEKWFSEFRMMLAYAAFGFAMAVSLQNAHALYIEQIDTTTLQIADYGSTTPSNYFFISLDNIAISTQQTLAPETGSRPANGVPALNGQVQNSPSNLANTFRLQFDGEKQLSNTNISDIRTETASYRNIGNRPSAFEPGPSILAEQSAYIDRFVIDFVKTFARDDEIDIYAIHRNFRAAAYSFYDGAAYQSAPGFSSVPENADGVNSDLQQKIEHTQFRILLSWLLRSLNDGSFFMYLASSGVVILGLKGLVEKFSKRH